VAIFAAWDISGHHYKQFLCVRSTSVILITHLPRVKHFGVEATNTIRVYKILG